MTLRAELVENWRSNPWLRREVACLPTWVVWMAVAWWFSLGTLGFVVGVLLIAAFSACGWKAVRVATALRIAHETAELKAREAAAVLRTPRVPDAGPDQCPVCAGYGLDALAKDDAFMERGALAKVVAWGSRRAHWDCAEWLPYVEPKQHFEPFETDGHMTYCACPQCSKQDGAHRAYSRCTFCGFYQFGPSRDAAAEKLIAHVKVCTKRPRPDVPLLVDKSFRSRDGLAINPGRVFTGPDGESYVDCTPGDRWMWPDLKGGSK